MPTDVADLLDHNDPGRLDPRTTPPFWGSTDRRISARESSGSGEVLLRARTAAAASDLMMNVTVV
jgi:hypothetical protein